MTKWVYIIIFSATFLIVFRLADSVIDGTIMGIFWGIVMTIALFSYNEKKKDKEAKETFEKLLKSAENGNSEAQLNLFEWLLKSAEQGNSEAQWRLAVRFCNGQGTKENQEKALFWAKKSAEQGNAQGEFLYSLYSECKLLDDTSSSLLKGIPLSEEAMFSLKKLLSSDSEIRWVASGLMNIINAKENKKEYYSQLVAGAKLNIPTAQYFLGIMYYTGIFLFEKDYKEAFIFFLQSAEQGDTGAQVALSICYECGKGVERNSIKAFEWAKKSAEQGDVVAQMRVSHYYALGIGTEVNKEKGKYWTKKIIENNNLKDDDIKESFENQLKLDEILSTIENKNKLEPQSNA